MFYIIKKFIFLFLFVFLTNCSAPGTVLMGPVFTGATTKSIAQASLSFGTNQVVRKIQETSKKAKYEAKKIVKKFEESNVKLKSLDFYASVKTLYLKDQQQKKEASLFHR